MSETKSRRDFFKGSGVAGAAALGFSIVKPQSVRGTPANSALTVGLVGCGRRGTHVAGLFAKNEFAKVAAVCDIYEDQIAEASKKFSGARTFKNISDLLASDVDAVYIATPPYLHPEHFEAAVKSRKHIFMEKPAGVDGAGCRRVLEAAKKADKTKRITVDYQQRYGADYKKAYEIVKSGQLGGIKMIRASWLGGGLPVRN
ncbi:MAG: Gfo/Idh/MocA family oxidoreductase, partial [Bryobacteraceae bacterium]